MLFFFPIIVAEVIVLCFIISLVTYLFILYFLYHTKNLRWLIEISLGQQDANKMNYVNQGKERIETQLGD